MPRPFDRRSCGERAAPRPKRAAGPAPEPEPREGAAGVVALLEAIGGADPAEAFRRAVERDFGEAVARSRRLGAELAIAPEVANPILTEALNRVLPARDGADEGR